MSEKKVFFLGVTGYIGGEIFVRMHEQWPKFEYTTLVRSQDNATAVQSAGITRAILCPDTSLEIVAEEAAKADIIINAVDADDLQLVKTILAATKKTFERTGKRPVYIHTSGTGVATDKAEGNLTEAAKAWIYDDKHPDHIKALDIDAPHRDVDLEIFTAGSDGGYVNAYIVAPATIYAMGRGPVRKISQQIPNLVRAMVGRGRGFVVGEGTSLWPAVHIRDLGDLYALIISRALGEDAVGAAQDPFERFYWGTNSEFSYGDVEKAIAELLAKKGRLPDGKVDTISYQELIGLNPMLGSVAKNSRCRGSRGLAIGWTPKSHSVFDSLEEDVDLTLKLFC